jgi:SHS2 domain-containing protein
MFETFDHTADLGLRISADDLNGLFAEAGRALTSILVENASDVAAREEWTVHVAGTDREYLLFDWLSDLRYRFEREHLLAAEFEVVIDAEGLTARIRGERVDRSRHRVSHEVKAITYHGLQVTETSAGWEAEVIVDI